MTQTAVTQPGNDEKKEKEGFTISFQQQQSLVTSINKQKLEVKLHNKNAKYMYHASFDANDLKNCGFGSEQVKNLENVGRLVESASNGHSQLQFSVDILNNHKNAKISIIKNDDFFPMKIVLELSQKPRQKIDILEQQIMDLNSENIQLKQTILKLETVCNRVAFGQFLRLNEWSTNSTFTKLPLEVAVYNKNINLSNGGLVFKYKGIYKITLGHRGGNGGNDVWTNFWMKDDNGFVVGSSNKFGNTHGGAPQQHSYTFLVKIDKTQSVYSIEMGRRGANKITIIGCWNTDNGTTVKNSNAIVTVVVEYLGTL
eukprot:324141_1